MNMKYKDVTKNQSKDTILAFILICCITALIKKDLTFTYGILGLSLMAMTLPQLFKPMAWIWFSFAEIMGTIMSKLILGLVFFGIITPLTFIIKLMGVDSMRIKLWKNNENSAFIDRNHQYTKADIEKPY